MLRLADLTFPAEPPVGLAVAIKGQRYDLIGYAPHQRRDGEMTRLAVWSGKCSTCGCQFVFRQSIARLPELRTCEQHRFTARRLDRGARNSSAIQGEIR